MAEPINIQIDPVHLRTQIRTIIDEELAEFAAKLWWAADVLDPERSKRQDAWISAQVEDQVAKRLKEAEK